jgi:hypothetical protein
MRSDSLVKSFEGRSASRMRSLVLLAGLLALGALAAACGSSSLPPSGAPRATTSAALVSWQSPVTVQPAATTASEATANAAAQGGDNSSCAPTTDAATSGGSPASLEASSAEVGAGSVAGQAWSLWAAKGETGAIALEEGGFVYGGREYGLCAGYPNPAELEMIDAGPHAVVYGVVGYLGLAKVDLSVGSVGSFSTGTALPSPMVGLVDGVSFFVGALPKPACSYTAFELNTTSPGVSAQHNLGFGGVGAGQGYYLSDNPGNAGSCVAGKIDPISFSQGVWALAPGQFGNDAGGGGPGPGNGSSVGAGGSDNSDCAPTTDAATSGGGPAFLEASSAEVASGSVAGQHWSLWAAKGESGADALEQGGFVYGGREYGLCPGYPNPAELEMIDAGANAVVYGVVGYPGLAKVGLSVGTIGSFSTGAALPSPAVRAVDGVSFFVGSLPRPACSYTALELNTTSPGVSAEHNLGFAGAGAGQGYYIGDNTGNSGSCVAGEIDPISFSQGIWALAPGQFQNGFG